MTVFNPLKVPITQFITTHRAQPAGDCAGSWIYLCEQNLGLATRSSQANLQTKSPYVGTFTRLMTLSACNSIWTISFLFLNLFFDCAASSFLCMGFSLVVAIGGYWTSLVAQMVKRLPTMREPWVQSLGWEDFWRR